MPSRSLNQTVTIVGFRVPISVLMIIGAILVASTLGAAAERNGLPAIGILIFVPRLVWEGQLWRLATWSLVVPPSSAGLLTLFFAVFMLASFGRDVAYAWGGLRFLIFWAATTSLTGLLLCLLSQLGPALGGYPYATPWPLVDAVIVAWALLFPSRTILFNFVLPVAGTRLVQITLVMTFVGALLDGFVPYLPHFLAIGLTFAYLRGGTPSRWWLSLKGTWLVRRHSRHLRPVNRGERGGPPTWLH